MTRRMLDSRLWANEHFGEMPMMARLLLLGIINHADDQGRIKGKLMYLRTEIFRYDTDVTNEQVAECLKRIEANGTIECYQADGKDCIQLLNWWDYQSLQFAAPSDMPRPATWQDRIRYNAKGGATLTCNWVTPKGEKPTDTCDQDGKPLPIVATLPPRNPGGRPPGKPPVNGRANPGGNPNKEEEEEEVKDQVEVKAAEGATPPPAAAIDPNVARLWAKWDANMPGVKTRVIVDAVNELLTEYSAAEIEEAITIACRRNKRYLSYVEGILARGAFSEAPPGNTYMNKGEKQNAAVDEAFRILEERGRPLH